MGAHSHSGSGKPLRYCCSVSGPALIASLWHTTRPLHDWLPSPLVRSYVRSKSPARLQTLPLDLSMSFSIIVLCCMQERWRSSSLLLGDNLNLLADGEASLLLVNHDLEALQVSQVGTGGPLDKLLSDGSLLPLAREVRLLGNLEEGASASATLDINLHAGE